GRSGSAYARRSEGHDTVRGAYRRRRSDLERWCRNDQENGATGVKVKLTLQRDGTAPADIVVTADSTATAGDVARHIAESDPARSVVAGEEDVLTLAVAPPTADQLEPLQPDVPIGEAAVGSGFAASVVNLGPHYKKASADHQNAVGVLRATDGPL